MNLSSDTPEGEEGSGLPINLVKQFLENQSKELQNHAQDIELKKLNEKNGYDYACKALDAQKLDRKERRSQITLFMKYGFWLTIIILLLVSCFVGVCVYTDNVGIIVSSMKVIAYILPSALGGYFFGLNRGKKSSGSSGASYAEVVED